MILKTLERIAGICLSNLSKTEVYESCGEYNAMRFIKINKTDDKVLVSSDSGESGESVVDIGNTKKGGIILFPIDVSETSIAYNPIAAWIKTNLSDYLNRMTDMTKEEDPSWSIGRYAEGRYLAYNGKIYDESSLSLEIAGVDSDTLKRITVDLCRILKQHYVLLYDCTANTIFWTTTWKEC